MRKWGAGPRARGKQASRVPESGGALGSGVPESPPVFQGVGASGLPAHVLEGFQTVLDSSHVNTCLNALWKQKGRKFLELVKPGGLRGEIQPRWVDFRLLDPEKHTHTWTGHAAEKELCTEPQTGATDGGLQTANDYFPRLWRLGIRSGCQPGPVLATNGVSLLHPHRVEREQTFCPGGPHCRTPPGRGLGIQQKNSGSLTWMQGAACSCGRCGCPAG